MNFPEKLRSIRQAAGMTQTELAEKLNVSRQAVSRWEMGSAMPDIENLIAMSDLFGVTLDDLLKDRQCAPEVTPEKADSPRYWDFLPKRWWILPVSAVGLRLLTFLMELMYLLFPGLFIGGIAASGGSSVTFLFSIPGLILLSTILLGLTACVFLWAFVRWIKVKK